MSSKKKKWCEHHWELYQESGRHLVDAVLPYHDAFNPPRPVAEVLQRLPESIRLLCSKPISFNVYSHSPGIVKAPTCCRHHWELHQESRRHLVDAALPYHDAFSPPRPVAEVLQRRESPDKLVQMVEKDMDKNLRLQLPLSTIIIR